MTNNQNLHRREFLGHLGRLGAVLASARLMASGAASSFKFRYLVGSCMFGELPLSDIVPLVPQTGSSHLDVWPRVHGNQREQMEAMGQDAFGELLHRHKVGLGCITRYDLGPFKLADELKVAGRFRCPVMVTGGKGPVGLKGEALKKAVAAFVEKLKPQLDVAGEQGVTIAIENHGRNLIDSPDSLKWLAELSQDRESQLGVALAPYHLEVLGLHASDLAGLIRDLGNRMAVFYAWQHGMGCTRKLPKVQELLQMPGRGALDFTPLVAALKEVSYRGFTEIFMHPVPRGIPILPTAQAVADEINRARNYLETCLAIG